jgi:signal transduction histidine kinase
MVGEHVEEEPALNATTTGTPFTISGQQRLLDEQARLRQLLQVTQPKGEPGTGLGLPRCKRSVEGWSGETWYEGGARTGSTFFFTIPSCRDIAQLVTLA